MIPSFQLALGIFNLSERLTGMRSDSGPGYDHYEMLVGLYPELATTELYPENVWAGEAPGPRFCDDDVQYCWFCYSEGLRIFQQHGYDIEGDPEGAATWERWQNPPPREAG